MSRPFPDKNRDQDYSRSQYGSDRFRTQNTSSDYARDERDHRTTTARTDQAEEEDSLRNHSENFLNDYRRHHGIKDIEEDPEYVDRGRDFTYVRHTGDYGDSYLIRKKKNYSGVGPKGYKRSDLRIQEDVSELLFHHPEIDASGIEVTVENGVVTLNGHVDNRSDKYFVEDEIENCPGVSRVQNFLSVGRSR